MAKFFSLSKHVLDTTDAFLVLWKEEPINEPNDHQKSQMLGYISN